MKNKIPSKQHAQAAFTLIELLTVIAIIGILAAIIIPTVGKVRNTAKNAQCLSNLKQIGMAALLYSSDNKDRTLPNDYWSGSNYLARYLSIPGANNASNDWLMWNAFTPKAVASKTALWCPAVNPDSWTPAWNFNYSINAQAYSCGPHYPPNPPGRVVLTTSFHAPSRLIMFIEGTVTNAWASQNNIEIGVGRHSANKVNAVFLDGHAKTVDYKPEDPDWQRMFDGK